MLIVCPSCATSYDVEPATMQPDGRRVRCVRCRAIWHAGPTPGEKLLAAAVAIAPTHKPLEEAIEAFAEEMAPEPAVANVMHAAAEAVRIEHQADGPPADEASLAVAEDGAVPEPADAEDGIPASDVPASIEVAAPPIAPVDLDDGQAPVAIDAEPAAVADAEPAEDIETYAARRERLNARRQSWRWPLSQLQSGVLALLLIDAILVGWRDDVVRIMPQTASFYSLMGLSVNVRGVALEDIATNTEQHEGVPVLVVEGNLVNTSHKIADVPRLKFAVRNTAGDEIYSWTAVPPRATLPPGETVSFRSRLASPPPDGQDVLVRFVTRHDIVAETH
jgi:predicted Zn finger-like uncharacterized protein